MAKRYSGDVELRIEWREDPPGYYAQIRAPGKRARAFLPWKMVRATEPTTPEAYDEAAKKILAFALREDELPVSREQDGNVEVARVFVAPCPIVNDES